MLITFLAEELIHSFDWTTIVDKGLSFTVLVGVIGWLLKQNASLQLKLDAAMVGKEVILKDVITTVGKNSFVLESVTASVKQSVRDGLREELDSVKTQLQGKQ